MGKAAALKRTLDVPIKNTFKKRLDIKGLDKHRKVLSKPNYLPSTEVRSLLPSKQVNSLLPSTEVLSPMMHKVGDPQGRLGAAFSTAVELGGNMARSINAGGKRNFLKQSAMYGTYGAAGGAGLAALQGNDPWEGAKSGFMKGFIGGAAVGGFAHATGTVGGGLKGFATGAKRVGSTYNMNRTGMVNRNPVSNQVKAIHKAEAGTRVANRVMNT